MTEDNTVQVRQKFFLPDQLPIHKDFRIIFWYYVDKVLLMDYCAMPLTNSQRVQLYVVLVLIFCPDSYRTLFKMVDEHASKSGILRNVHQVRKLQVLRLQVCLRA